MTRKENIIFSIVLVLVTFYGLIYSYSKIEPTSLPIHPYFVPTVVIGIAFALSIIRLAQAIGMNLGDKKDHAMDVPRKSLVTMLLVAAYAWTYRPLGFLISSLLFMAVEMFILWPRPIKKWWLLPVIDIGFVGAVYMLFTRVFTVTLPTGILGFIY